MNKTNSSTALCGIAAMKKNLLRENGALVNGVIRYKGRGMVLLFNAKTMLGLIGTAKRLDVTKITSGIVPNRGADVSQTTTVTMPIYNFDLASLYLLK